MFFRFGLQKIQINYFLAVVLDLFEYLCKVELEYSLNLESQESWPWVCNSREDKGALSRFEHLSFPPISPDGTC